MDALCSDDAVGLGKKLFPLFALALDLNENFFEDKVFHITLGPL